MASARQSPAPVDYNPDYPHRDFRCPSSPTSANRSIYNLWRQVLEYFDAFLIGLTATPSKQTFGFFQQNLVMEYSHAQAVADNVNVDFDVYRIRTQITERGSSVEAGYYVDRRDRQTRKVPLGAAGGGPNVRAQPARPGRGGPGPDPHRRPDLPRPSVRGDIPTTGRTSPRPSSSPRTTATPTTLCASCGRSSAKGNDFCQKITYKTTGARPEDLLASFRNSYNPRIVVTVDMIATGTDIKPVEVVFFMRNVRSRSFFEQMKGRGVRTISATDFNSVTPDAPNKDRFVIVDAVGVTETELSDSYSLERQPTVPFDKLLDLVGMGSRDPDVLSSLASRPRPGWTAN